MLHDGPGSADRVILIRGARVYDRALDIHRPQVKDVIVEGNRIASVSAAGELAAAQIRDLRGGGARARMPLSSRAMASF